MTPFLHTPAPPQAPGCHGRAPKRYAAGRVCETPGCSTILNHFDSGPRCWPCQDKGNSGSSASAHGTAVTNAAPAARHEKEESVGKHGKRGEMRAKVLELVRGGHGGFCASYVAGALEIAAGSARFHLDNLVEGGELLVSRDLGYKLYRARTSVEGEKSAKTAPAHTQAPAPVIPPPERPATPAPAPVAPTIDREPAPFAGLDWIDPDDEIEALEICVLQLGRLASPARNRVTYYLASRFMVDWPDAKETT